MGLSQTFSVGVVSTPNYIILNVIKVKYPTIIVQSFTYGPAPTSFNAFVDNLDPVNYYFDWRVSVDGIDPGILVSRFLINAATNQIVQEYRYYVADRGVGSDPSAGESVITDDYFLGKSITAIFKEGTRFLLPEVEWQLSGNVLSILNGFGEFTNGESLTVIINYKTGSLYSGGEGLIFKGPYLLTSNQTLNTTHYNSRINCAGESINSLIIELPPAVGVPDLTYFYFSSRGGLAEQTTIKASSGDTIYYDGFPVLQDLPEIWISKGEYIWIQLVNGAYEVIQSSPSIAQVGEMVIPQSFNHRGVLIADMSLKTGAVYPRLEWYIKNSLPTTNKFTTTQLENTNYKDVLILNGIRGQFGLYPDLSSRLFRMPWVEGMSLRALQNLTDFSISRPADTEGRVVNQVGGYQPSMVGPHTHPDTPMVRNDVDRGGGTSLFSLDDKVNSKPNSGTNNITENIGILIGYRF